MTMLRLSGRAVSRAASSAGMACVFNTHVMPEMSYYMVITAKIGSPDYKRRAYSYMSERILPNEAASPSFSSSSSSL